MKQIVQLLKRKIAELFVFEIKKVEYFERIMINQGKLLAQNQLHRTTDHQTQFQESEFSIFSQFGEDGIIQYLTQLLDIKNKTFIEFGVEDFSESNCRFLMMKDNWRGFVIDGSKRNISVLKNSYYFWKFDLQAKHAFINRENVNQLLEESGFDHDLGILSIDLDGNDYFILASLSHWKPRILICEFNPTFGPSRKIAVPYDAKFKRFQHHFSGLYWGASLSAIDHAAKQMGYILIGTNSAGHNAFFIREDLLESPLSQVTPEQAFRKPSYRDSRNVKAKLDFLDFNERQRLISGLPIFNIETNQIEPL